ncbi:MAG: hypothetical protein U9P14_10955 [Gemmatimonadota bacterium]|nr:hypothetical protein [Gemmatimonadota bacterium]
MTVPGSYDQAGTTYMLTRDISSPASTIFLGKDVTLDLNGYTIAYADGDYEHVPNYGFEEGLKGWDTSRASEAKVEDTEKVHIFIGKKILRLSAGDEIVSQYVNLPVANRSYFAICGVLIRGMRVSLYVEAESGKQVRCANKWSTETLNRLWLPSDLGPSFDYRNTRVSCPVENRTVRLGGGFVVAHLHGLPAGKYRIRVKAETDCLLDHIDIRPAMDVGIGIVENTLPWAHNDFLYAGQHCAFFDYTVQGSSSEPVPSIPRVTGQGAVTIKNGIIKSRAVGVLSWGIQSTARGVKLVLDNVKVIASGINTNAVDIPQGELTDCRFEIDTPFIINRHKSEHTVVLRSEAPSEVSNCEFIGGQGCLTAMGRKSLVHDNLFVNRQMVTNHYCVMARGDSSKIFNNRFEPEIGSGVEIYVHKYIEIYNNSFRIEASPPTCEYGHEDYSVNAIRVADYRAVPGSLRSCAENRIYSNTFHIIGRDYPLYPDYVPMAYAIFHSVSGGDTYYYDNDIFVEQTDPGSKAEAAACYITGNNGGKWYNNRITTNIHAFWVATRYGGAKDAKIYNNTIIKAQNAPHDFKPIRMGWSERPNVKAQNIEFRSNVFQGCSFDLDITDQDHSYSVYWTLEVRATDAAGNPIPDAEVWIFDRNGSEVLRQRADVRGSLSVELLEYVIEGRDKKMLSPYTIKVDKLEKTVVLDKNREVTFNLK